MRRPTCSCATRGEAALWQKRRWNEGGRRGFRGTRDEGVPSRPGQAGRGDEGDRHSAGDVGDFAGIRGDSRRLVDLRVYRNADQELSLCTSTSTNETGFGWPAACLSCSCSP